MTTAIMDRAESYQAPPVAVRRIALVGHGPLTAPPDGLWLDGGIEKWTLNGTDLHRHPWDRLFELHAHDVIAREGHLADLQRVAYRPVYMKAADPTVPCSVAFPLAEFTAFYGDGCPKLAQQPYVESTVAFMLGYAIMQLLGLSRRLQQSPDHCEIELWGIELFEQDAYAQQRANFEFFAGYALGAGIRLRVPTESAVFNPRAGIYEYENGAVMDVLEQARAFTEQRAAQLQREFAQARAENDAAVAKMQTLSGVMQEVAANQKLIQTFMRGGRIR